MSRVIILSAMSFLVWLSPRGRAEPLKYVPFPLFFRQPPAVGVSTQRDHFGDPLPAGALRRLGTVQRRTMNATLAVTRDGKHIVGLRWEKHLAIWNATTGKLLKTHALPIRFVSRSVLSPAGDMVVTCEPDAAMRLWDVRTGKPLRSLSVGDRHITELTFSPGSRYVAALETTDEKPFLSVWVTTTGKKILDMPMFASRLQYIDFSPDGRHLVTSSGSWAACWEMPSGKILWNRDITILLWWTITKDGKLITSSPSEQVLDIKTGKSVTMTLPNHSWSRERLQASPAGRFLVVHRPNQTEVWRVGAKKHLFRFPGSLRQIVFTADDRFMITDNGTLQVWDLQTRQPRFKDNFSAGHADEITSMRFTSAGTRLITGSGDGTVRVWDVASGKCEHVFMIGNMNTNQIVPARLRRLRGHVNALHATPDGRFVIAGGDTRAVKVMDLRTGKFAAVIPVPEHEYYGYGVDVCDVHLRADGKQAVTIASSFPFNVTGERLVRWWRVGSAKALREHKLRFGEPKNIFRRPLGTLSPDGKRYVVEQDVVALRMGKKLRRLQGKLHRSSISSGEPRVFSPDGLLIAGIVQEPLPPDTLSGTLPTGPQIWDAWTGQRVAAFSAPNMHSQLAFHRHSRYLTTANGHGIQIYDVPASRLVWHFPIGRHLRAGLDTTQFGCPFALSPDAKTLATSHPDGTVLLWPTSPYRPLTKPLRPGELVTLWQDLKNPDAKQAWTAVWHMCEHPAETTAFLQKHLHPVTPIPPTTFARLLKNLDSSSFRVRQKTFRELQSFEQRAEAAARQTLKSKLPLEVHLRVEKFLVWLDMTRPPSLDEHRRLRAVHVLAQIGTRAARRVLERIGRGVDTARLTRHARWALLRQP